MSNTNLTLVLMAGLPGAGKTTLSSELSSDLGWQVINKDKYKEVLMARGLDDNESSREAYDQSFAIISKLLLSDRKSVILDSAALEPFILEKAKELVRDAGNAQLKVILLIAGRRLRKKRIRSRPLQITKIRVNPSNEAKYRQYFAHLPSDSLILYTRKALNKCQEDAEIYLKSKTATKKDEVDTSVSVQSSAIQEALEPSMT